MDPICVPAAPGDAAAILDMMRDYYPIEGATFRPEVQGPALRALLADPPWGGSISSARMRKSRAMSS